MHTVSELQRAVFQAAVSYNESDGKAQVALQSRSQILDNEVLIAFAAAINDGNCCFVWYVPVLQ